MGVHLIFQVRTYDLAQIHSYVKKHKPDMFENFILLEKISQIDFWRYLVMLVDGGMSSLATFV